MFRVQDKQRSHTSRYLFTSLFHYTGKQSISRNVLARRELRCFGRWIPKDIIHNISQTGYVWRQYHIQTFRLRAFQEAWSGHDGKCNFRSIFSRQHILSTFARWWQASWLNQDWKRWGHDLHSKHSLQVGIIEQMLHKQVTTSFDFWQLDLWCFAHKNLNEVKHEQVYKLESWSSYWISVLHESDPPHQQAKRSIARLMLPYCTYNHITNNHITNINHYRWLLVQSARTKDVGHPGRQHSCSWAKHFQLSIIQTFLSRRCRRCIFQTKMNNGCLEWIMG